MTALEFQTDTRAFSGNYPKDIARFQHPLNGFEKPTLEIEGEEETPGYTVISPSDLEIIKHISELPDFDETNPDLNALKPSSNQVIGALEGLEGHFLDYLVTDLAIHHLKISRKKFTPLTRFPTRLLAKHDGLKDEDKRFLDSALTKARKKYRLYRLIDIPCIVADIRKPWRENMHFARKKGNSRQVFEGWAYPPEEMRGLWNSDEVRTFGERFLTAYDSKFANGELPLEVRMLSLLKNELELTMKINFPYFNTNLRLRADYVLRGQNGQVVIIDNKFSPWAEDTLIKRMQRLLYSSAVNFYTCSGVKNGYEDIPFELLDPGDVVFIYKVFDTKNPKPTFQYQDATLPPHEIEELKNELNIWATQWWFKHKDYIRIKKINESALSMPRLSKKEKETPYQKRLF